MDRVFVVVVTYNGMEWYERCFSSFRLSTIPVTTIVVDNDSHDGTIDFIRKEFPEIVVIQSPENLGFGKANNMGIRYALDHGADYVFLLNQDAWIDSDALEILVSIHQKHPEYGLLSPMHLNVDRTGLVMKFFCRQPNNEKLITDLYLNQLSDVYDTQYIHAAAWLLPKQTLQTIGGFDPIFHHYAEDDDYLNRLRYHRMKIGVCPDARIVHDHHNRVQSPEAARYRHRQSMLAEYMDLNHPFRVGEYLSHYSWKWVRSLFRLRTKECIGQWDDLTFMLKNASEIKKHRKQNQKKGTSWL